MQLLVAAFNSNWEPLVWFALGVFGAAGIVAILNPRRVTELALHEPSWVESTTGPTGTQRPVGNGFVALAVSRLFGVAILSAVAAIGYFLAQR